MKDWYDIYLNEINLKGNVRNYLDYKIKNKKKLINLIKKYSHNKKIMEAGAGTGIISIYMSSIGYDVTAIDIDKKIQNLSKKICDEYTTNNKPNFIIKNIMNIDYTEKYFDVIFSNGVLEHFSDKDIIRALTLQIKQSDTVIVGIPTTFFKKEESLYGDERYLSIKKWRDLITKSGGYIVEETSYDYRTLKEKIMGINKIFNIKPFRIFVIKKSI